MQRTYVHVIVSTVWMHFDADFERERIASLFYRQNCSHAFEVQAVFEDHRLYIKGFTVDSAYSAELLKLDSADLRWSEQNARNQRMTTVIKRTPHSLRRNANCNKK